MRYSKTIDIKYIICYYYFVGLLFLGRAIPFYKKLRQARRNSRLPFCFYFDYTPE